MSQSQSIFVMADRTDSTDEPDTEPDVVTHGDVKLELDTSPASEPIVSAGFSIPRSIEHEEKFIAWRQEGDRKAPLAPEFTDTGGVRKRDATALSGGEKSYPYAKQFVHQSQEKLGDDGADGVGIVLTDDDDLVCYDLDNCVDPETGAVEQWAWDAVQELGSFTEISASGTGLHVWARGENPGELANKNSELGFECYCDTRYIGITCDRVAGTPYAITDRTEIGLDIQRALLDVTGESDDVDTTSASRESIEADTGSVDGDVIDAIVERASESDADFQALFSGRIPPRYDDDHSRADMALCSKLSWWCNSDTVLIDACFRRSGLMRAKWDADRGSITYGQLTIRKANRMNPEDSGIDW